MTNGSGTPYRDLSDEERIALTHSAIETGRTVIERWVALDDFESNPSYRRRWGVECLFGDAKTRGLNLEDTRLTEPAKIDTLTAVLTLAITWIYKSASVTMGMKAIPRKTHGRRRKSWFRTGFDALRNALLHTPQTAATWWTESCPKRLQPN